MTEFFIKNTNSLVTTTTTTQARLKLAIQTSSEFLVPTPPNLSGASDAQSGSRMAWVVAMDQQLRSSCLGQIPENCHLSLFPSLLLSLSEIWDYDRQVLWQSGLTS